jgi:hypothetical protein
VEAVSGLLRRIARRVRSWLGKVYRAYTEPSPEQYEDEQDRDDWNWRTP